MFLEKYITYPYPISQIIDKYLRLEASKMHEKHSVLGDLFEVTVKFSAIVLLKETAENPNKLNSIFPNGLDFLKHPSLGQWLSIIRSILANKIADGFWTRNFYSWWNNSNYETQTLTNFQKLSNITFSNGTTITEKILNSLVNYRNKVWKGHGAVIIDENELLSRIEIIEKVIAELIKGLSFFENTLMFYTKSVELIDENKVKANCLSLNGINKRPLEIVSQSLKPKEIYLTKEKNSELNDPPLMLTPLLEWQQGEKEETIYFFNDTRRTKLEYLSYLDGRFYYHKEIRQELEKLLKVSFGKTEGVDSSEVQKYSIEARKEKAREYILKAEKLFAEEKYDSAIVAYEEAIEWDRTADAIVGMCKAMYKLGEDKEYIISNLEYAFEIDPEHREAIKLYNKLTLVNDERKENNNDKNKFSIDFLRKNKFTLFDVIIPPKYYTYSLPIWLSFVVISFTFFFAVLWELEITTGESLNYFSVLLMMLQAVIMIIGLTVIKDNFIDAYFNLAWQLNDMRMERFNDWFLKVYSNMFGNFTFSENNKKVKLNLEKEKYFFFFAILFSLFLTIMTIVVQKIYLMNLSAIIVYFFANMVLWLITAPILRIIIYSTLFIKEYSSHDLFPITSISANNAFYKLKSIYLQNLILVLFFYIINLSWNLFAVKDSNYTDFIGIGFELLVFLYWSILSPFFIIRALKVSKNNIVLNYLIHLKHALKEYVKSPNETSLSRLEWLKKNKIHIEELPQKLFTVPEKLFLTFFYFIFFFGAFAYYLIRTKTFNKVINMIYQFNIWNH